MKNGMKLKGERRVKQNGNERREKKAMAGRWINRGRGECMRGRMPENTKAKRRTKKQDSPNAVRVKIIPSTAPSAGRTRSLFSASSCAGLGARLAEVDEAPQRPNIKRDAKDAGAAASVAVLTSALAYAGEDEPDEPETERSATESPRPRWMYEACAKGRQQ
ncbi:hypothetical protein C8R44DRAFT_747936 [Mycena epipterygia]|nr:hypothetical protein C8R44DRAFT_747936 [Mycena epipterygia]